MPNAEYMSKLPVLTPKKTIAFLEKSGFVLDHSTGSHFVFYHKETRRRAVVPVHKKDLPQGTLLAILRQAGLEREDLFK